MPAYFHHLQDCRASWRVVLGDARLSLGGEADGAFSLIVLDAFSGDAIPVHLLTREALRIYLSEVLVHSWDLAGATGQSPGWDDTAIEIALATMRAELPVTTSTLSLNPALTVSTATR